jgi:hypothetical protein
VVISFWALRGVLTSAHIFSPSFLLPELYSPTWQDKTVLCSTLRRFFQKPAWLSILDAHKSAPGKASLKVFTGYFEPVFQRKLHSWALNPIFVHFDIGLTPISTQFNIGLKFLAISDIWDRISSCGSSIGTCLQMGCGGRAGGVHCTARRRGQFHRTRRVVSWDPVRIKS